MVRLHAIVEGQTEEEFFNSILRPHLASSQVYVDARCVETGRRGNRIYRGGLLDYGRARKDICLWMKEDQNPDAYFTTMFDMYALPTDFPGYDEARRQTDPLARAEKLEQSLKKDITHHLGQFLPYVQPHEFEALLFTDPDSFRYAFPERHEGCQELQRVRQEFPSPEHIDDGSETAPSKRILAVFADYDKVQDGPLLAQHMGLERIREECKHFNDWLEGLEGLAR
jgi:hypothetical protein